VTLRKHLPHVALAACIAIATSLAGAATAALAATSIGAYTTKHAFTFVATPKLHPAKITIKRHRPASKLAPGYLMVASFPDLTQNKLMAGQSGPLILDNRGQPVWFKPVPTDVLANNLTTQRYDGKPALSWWQGVVSNQGEILKGKDIVVDQHYRTVATLGTVDGWIPALHEFVVSGHDAWAIVSKNIQTDFSAEGGPANGTLIDTAVAEFDLGTHKMVRLWDPVGHVPLSDSYGRPNPQSGVWDAYHTNSVKLVGHDKLLVGMRNTWAAYLIDLPSGKIEWKLGGKPLAGTANFSIPRNAQFEWQHDVELHSGNIATVFDDHCCAIVGPGKFANPTGPSRALTLKLNTANHTASLVSQITRGPNFNAAFLGSTQPLAGGNELVSWGSQPYFSEYDKTGRLLLDARWPSPDLSYRAYRERWTGSPSYRPDGAVRKKRGNSTVFASWNGATQVVSWRVLAGRDGSHLKTVATKRRTGFETWIAFKHTYKAYKAVALDRRGKVLGRSKVFPAPAPQVGGY
jgi:hypothetical protein